MLAIITYSTTTAVILSISSNLIISRLSSWSLNLLKREAFIILIEVVQATFTKYVMSHTDFEGNSVANIQQFYAAG